ncbi:MAG: efflux RND transporter permease subunit [Gammaproteobacteria bacterium]|nr:efflux RND transporter permease subunit [Gammaproteobacteria bacterium]
MNLPELSIRRHVLAYMLSGVLILFGIISFRGIGVDRFPAIDFPFVSVTTRLVGASPDIIDSSVTNIIESAVNSVPGVNHIESSSSPGTSVVSVSFDLSKDVDVAFNEVQAKINQILPLLPSETDAPVVAKIEFGGLPIMWLSLTGDRTLQQLNVYAKNTIKKRLETIDGVGQVQIGGERERNIRVNLNLERMAGYGITVQDIIAAFGREHIRLPGGFLVGESSEQLIKLDLEFHNIPELENLIVSHRQGLSVRLKDIATVEDSLEDFRKLARFNGEPTVGLGIVKISNANTVAIVDEVQRRLETEIIPQLPPGMKIQIAHNDASLIQELVKGLQEHLVEGTILTALVVLLFLRSLRSTFIIAVSIPVSLLGAIAVMYFAGYTFNTMTLLALLLLIGVVVDDAIVVLENIFRIQETSEPDKMKSALIGTNQVVFAVIAASLTLVSIFIPVIFMEGIIGRFFESFGVVVTFGVLVSLFVSLTLTPMLCSRFLKVQHSHGVIYNMLEAFFRGMEKVYSAFLRVALNFRWIVMLLTVLVVYSSGFFFANIGKGFMPTQDEGRFIISVKTPLGSSVTYTEEKLVEIENVLAKHEEIVGYFSAIGIGRNQQANSAIFIVRMADWNDRDISQQELIKTLSGELAQLAGVKAFATELPAVGGSRGEPLQFVLVGPDVNEVSRLANQLQERLLLRDELGPLDLGLELDLPQLDLTVDRERAANLGLSTQSVAMAVNVLAGGLDVGRYNDIPGDGERYDIRLKAEEGKLTYPDDLSLIYLRSNTGDMVRLDTIASFESSIGPAVISKFDLQYSAKFFSTPTVAMAEAVEIVKAEAAEIMPLGYQVKMIGQAEEFAKTANYVVFALITALIMIYMVLASQFNSFIQPVIIMAAQPLAIIGGVAALWLTDKGLNIYSMIGLVLLMGLVAKNSILLVDLTNQLRESGKDISTALIEACPIRLRPVLMTSLTVILTLLPPALGLGAGSDTNGPLAIAVIGGMVSSTLLTLIVVPAAYSLVEGGLLKWARFRGK